MASNPESLNGNAANQPEKPYYIMQCNEKGEVHQGAPVQGSYATSSEAQTAAKEEALENDCSYLVLETMMVIKPIRQAAVIYSRRG